MCAARSRRVVSLMVPIAALVCASAVPALPQTVPGAAIVKIHNEKVHVVGQTLAPGQAERRSGDRPGIVLFLDAGTAAVTAAGGDARTRIVQRGDGIYDPRLAGTVRNVGGSSLRLLRISYLGNGRAETWGTSGLSSNYTLLAEDRLARVYDIRIAAGGSEPQHTHHDRIVICLSGADLEHVMPDGRRETSSLKTDDVVWRRGGTHIGRNLGRTALWAIAVEPK